MTAPPFDWAGFRRGLRAAACTGGLVLCGSFVGFGALIHASGFTIAHGLAMTFTMWALPGQVVLIGMMGAGAGLAATAFAVSLTAVRLMPMVVALMADIRVPGRQRWMHLLAAHLTAATVWLESRRVFGTLDRPARLPYVLGISAGFVPTMAVMTVIGYHVADMLPPLLAACLVFLTPTYFLLGLVAGARDRVDWMSLVFGLVLLAVFQGPAPELAMMIAGVAGGTLAFVIDRLRRRAGGDA